MLLQYAVRRCITPGETKFYRPFSVSWTLKLSLTLTKIQRDGANDAYRQESAMAEPKRHLIRELGDLCRHNKDGGFSTQAARQEILVQAGRQLLEGGFRNLGADGLRQKHVTYLVERWKGENLSAATIKNRLSHVRWWANKIGKHKVVPAKNSDLGIENRVYVTNVSKAKTIGSGDLSRIKDEYVKMSLELQRAFGLRREESIKFQPMFAISGGNDKIILKASWCKGGRAREVPITTDYQKDVLSRAAKLAGNGSLIPPDKKYVEQLKRYEHTTARAGLSKLHGLRHEYAQARFVELCGFECPAKGGPTSKQLSAEQREIDLNVRLKISVELGHARENITAVYLGR
jgi:hypothetical protein